MRTVAGLIGMLGCLVSLAATAQEGHPLAGIWSGEWTSSAGTRTYVVLDLYWENTTLSGNINRGFPDAATVVAGALNSSDWSAHLEATGTDREGNAFRTVIDGQIENLGSASRTLTGTWQQGGVTGSFLLTRE